MLVVTHQDGSALRQPAERALHHPAARLVTGRAWAWLFQLAHSLNVWRVLVLGNHFFAVRVVVCFVQAKMLRVLLGRLRPIHYDGLDGFLQQLVVVDIRTVNDDAERTTLLVDDQATFDTVFPAIRGVAADCAPPKRALPIEPSALCHSQ